MADLESYISRGTSGAKYDGVRGQRPRLPPIFLSLDTLARNGENSNINTKV